MHFAFFIAFSSFRSEILVQLSYIELFFFQNGMHEWIGGGGWGWWCWGTLVVNSWQTYIYVVVLAKESKVMSCIYVDEYALLLFLIL